jgi:hypothetical protein
LVSTQNFSCTGTSDWKYVTLDTPVAVDGTQNLWITIYQSGITYPATCCNNTGDPNGRWVSTDGVEWGDLMVLAPSLTYTWMVRGFVTNQAKSGDMIELEGFTGEVGAELSSVAIDPQTPEFAPATRADLVSYNVYRSTSAGSGYALIGTVPAVAGQEYYEYYDRIAAGDYYYQVTAVYSNGCESAPAVCAATGQPYVFVDVTAIDESGNEIAVYPNPTSGNVKIEARGMNHITVVSVLGQVVFDADVTGDEIELNMAQYNTGVYVVRIATENGVSTQRVTVVR